MNKVFFKPLFDGTVEARARDNNGEVFIIENAEAVLLKEIEARGYTLALKPKQNYQRLTINL